MCLKNRLANRGHETIQTFVTAGSNYYPSGRENKNGKIVLEGLRKEEMETCMADSHTSEAGVGGWRECLITVLQPLGRGHPAVNA